MGKRKTTPEFKTFKEAIDKADKNTPDTMETLNKVRSWSDYPMTTKDDFRWFVLFNMLRAIADRNADLEEVYLQRAQDNILRAANKYLK